MKIDISYKIPNGKLLSITMEYNKKNLLIKNIRITGDFFLYPEEAIENLEEYLQNTLLSEEKLFDKISSFIESNNVTIIGFKVEDLVKVILAGGRINGNLAST